MIYQSYGYLQAWQDTESVYRQNISHGVHWCKWPLNWSASFFLSWIAPSRKGHDVIAAKDCWFNIGGACLSHKYFHYQGIIIAYFSEYFWFMMGYYGRVETLQNTQNANVLSI